MGAFDATTTVTDGVTDNLAQYHNELKTAADHAMSAVAYAAYGTPASMTGNVTLTDASLPILSYAPTAARDLTLPAVATTNHPFYVINRSGTYAITVKDAAAATITTVAVNSTAFLVSDGANSWYPMGGGLTKAAAADVTTGTDDAKYVTSLAIKNSVNVPNVAPSTSGNVLTSNGTAWTSAAAGSSSKFACNGRLTLQTGVAISTTDQVDKTTLYFTPYQGNQIGLYDGSSAWTTISFAELSLNISAFTASKPYDIWVYNNAGTATLDSTVWTSGTARATALALQDGVYVKTGATTRRYVGTIYMDAASKCQDTVLRRYVWNYYNSVPRKVYVTDATASWTYTTATWRSANASTANRVEAVIGVAEYPVNIRVLVSATQTNAAYRAAGIGLDRTDGNDAGASYFSNGAGGSSLSSSYYGIVAVGYHFFQWTEIAEAVGTCTWYSNVIGTYAGIIGDIFG